MTVDTLFARARLLTLEEDASDLGAIADGAVAVANGRIVYAGPAADLPDGMQAKASEIIDCEGRLVTPGLIDCHTHLVHGGERSNEFEMRLKGATYQEIARAGGGIAASVAATRTATEDALFDSAATRLDRLLAEGVTTIEIKSGYGLDGDSEARSLRAARRLGRERLVAVKTSFLGAHALPPEWQGDRDGYIQAVAEQMLPTLAAEGLVDAVDGFCEEIAFSPAQISCVFAAAQKLGLPVKLHADQLTDQGAASLAARHHALSADHLEYTSDEGAAAMADAGTVAVLLPGAFYFLRETRMPPVDSFRRHGTRMAVATDYNPGTSPLLSLLTAMNMAATCFRLTVDECLAGVTREAARALGIFDQTGSIEVGKWCDLAIWNVGRPAELVCRIGDRPLHARVWHGKHAAA